MSAGDEAGGAGAAVSLGGVTCERRREPRDHSPTGALPLFSSGFSVILFLKSLF